ncbi:TATA box binding protein associated factor (TAF) [Corchorus olitorius]|uniref:TATA box binding protein associated factor (TAF) n=1 Tax=Corchorus olitorius TaxID=93759 RepID=A0A1R3KBC1_9ROSI|nr:TATA box binding protein associated factor (TAF) [Corchorus olitorius]
MSNVPKEAIEVIAQSIGITNLSPDVALALAPDVEYRVREIMQEAIKCMRHSRRTLLTAEDVDSALKLRNVEPIYGFTSRDPRFKRAAADKGLFYIDDKDVEFKEVIESPLPKAPLDTSVTAHWLAIEGIQPAIPENASVEAPPDGKKAEYKEDGLSDNRLSIKHVLPRELQLYFDKVVELTMKRPVSVVFKQALLSLATDSGLHPLVPYFTCFIADEVARNLNHLPLTFALMRVARSLLHNEHIHIEPYLHQLMPSVITCLVTKRLGNKFTDNHWELRNFAAKLLASICKRFGHVYHNLQPRVTRTLLHAFLDPTKTLPQHYGAIRGLAALGPSVVRLLILPNLEAYLQLLEPEMLPEKQKNEIRRHEAWCVHGALLRAAGLCMYDRLKMFPSLLATPARPVWKSSGKVVTTNKRKASADNLMQQPPVKKIASDGAIGMMPINSMQVDMQGAVGGFSTGIGGSNMGVSSISRQLSNDHISGREVSGRVLKTSSVLAQAWKEDTDAGNLLASLFELYGNLCIIEIWTMGFLITTLIFAVIGVIASLCTRICCNRGPSTNLFHLTLVITATVCCWMMWAIVYLAQMKPLIVPILSEGE